VRNIRVNISVSRPGDVRALQWPDSVYDHHDDGAVFCRSQLQSSHKAGGTSTTITMIVRYA
jgi:hypothetical protein